jgi:hypothetical protein
LLIKLLTFLGFLVFIFAPPFLALIYLGRNAEKRLHSDKGMIILASVFCLVFACYGGFMEILIHRIFQPEESINLTNHFLLSGLKYFLILIPLPFLAPFAKRLEAKLAQYGEGKKFLITLLYIIFMVIAWIPAIKLLVLKNLFPDARWLWR